MPCSERRRPGLPAPVRSHSRPAWRGHACSIAALAASVLLAPAPLHGEPCRDCHDKDAVGAGSRSVHLPFAHDDCTACHGEHGERQRLVLLAEGYDLCADCHDRDEPSFSRRHGNVRGDRAPCISCHDPHRSTEAKLLLPRRHRPLAFGRCDSCHRSDGRLQRPAPQLCKGCHQGEQFAGRIVHAPVKDGDCLACHDPHASREPWLLKEPYSASRRIGSLGEVALCLGCHDRDALVGDRPGGTLFRAGGANYHALHVSGPARGPAGRGGGLSCRNCHHAHSSEGPRLVRRELDCGGVPCLVMDYRRSSTGGACLSGCHGPQSYAFLGAPEPPRPEPPGPARPELPRQSELERSINKRCVGCHQQDIRRFAKASIHAPVRAGACTFCHIDHGPENRLILLNREDRVCGRCHDLSGPAARGAHGGFALAGSRCSECHDPHSGDGRALPLPLRHEPFAEGDCAACHGAAGSAWRIGARVTEVCAACHDTGDGPNLHSALRLRDCTACHAPHAAREASLLRAPLPLLCFGCHAQRRFTGQTVHSPVEEGDCAACHPPHRSPEAGLLAGPYPIDRFVPFDPGRYGLCWECHDEGALTDPGRGADTGFSDASGRNLHALHLRDTRTATELGPRIQHGLSCRNCHEAHATEDPRLVRRSLDCAGVPCLQMEYHKVGAGGRCSGGCHDRKSYLPAAGR